MQPLVNDFFCGCGGMGVGFMSAGYKIAGAWDFDKYAVQSYRHNVGDHVKQADIREMKWSDVPFAHVWAFGFPCQDLSVAGKQAGLLLKCQSCGHEFAIDPENFQGHAQCPECGSTKYKAASRSGCFYEIMRLVDETRENKPENLPAVLVAENVKGLSPYIPILTAELKQRGYNAHIRLYNSKFWNVAQNRERYYIAATREDLPDTLEMPEQNEDPELVPRLSEFLDDEVPEKFYIPDEKAQKIIEQALQKLSELGKVHATITPDRIEKRQNGRRAKEDEEPMFTLTAQDLHGVIINDNKMLDICVNDRGFATKPAQVTETAPCLRAQDHGNQPKVIEATEKSLVIDDTYGYEEGIRVYDDVSPTLRAHRQGLKVLEEKESQPEIKVLGMLENSGTTQQHNNRVHDTEGISPTLTAVAGGTHHIKILDTSCYKARRLTPTEYGRLQAFPVDGNWEQVVSDSQAYKQFGNAVTTTVAAGVATSIAVYLKKCGILEKEEREPMAEPTTTAPAEESRAEAMTENPAIVQIMAIIQPKRERLELLQKESNQIKTEIEALELAISTIKNN